MSEGEAFGNLVGGAMLGRAVEPDTGVVAADGHTAERACLNCATPLVGDYCHVCGQRGHVHRTLGAFFHDLLHGVFHFEGKIWTTLPLLAWRPGVLTRGYIEGKRARYVSPLALFLFSVFVMFGVVNSLTSPINIDTGKARAEMAADHARATEQVRRIAAERTTAATAGRPTAKLDERLASAREEEQLLKAIADRGFLRGSAIRVSDDVPGWLAEPLRHASDNPDLLIYKLQNNAYKYSWALIPLSLPFMWLLFPFSRRFRAYDHIVFVTYSLSFMTLLVVVATLVGSAGLAALAGLMMVIPPLHMYRQLKQAYGLGRWGALWRTVLLTFFSLLAITMFIALLFALGIF